MVAFLYKNTCLKIDNLFNFGVLFSFSKEFPSYLGKDNSFKQEDPVAEERIAAILSEAQRSMKGGRPDFFSSPVFLNGGDPHHQHQQQAHHAQHHHQLPAGIKMEHSSSLSKLNHSSIASDNLSDNGGDSEREEKVGGGDQDRKSPANALNATALATINNFYRNLDSQNNSFGGADNSQTTRSSRQSNSKSSSSLNSKQQQPTVEEELLQSPDIMRLYQVNCLLTF